MTPPLAVGATYAGVVYVGGSPTVLTFANATMIKLLPTYNMHDIRWDVDVWIRGRGLAAGNRTFVYANYLYEVSPRSGSPSTAL